MDLIQILKALSDETRMRILNLLNYGDLCVCEIEVLLDVNQSNTSRHLNKLYNAKVIDYYKVAKYVYYKINENTVKEFPFIKEVIETEAAKLSQCQIDYEKQKRHKESGVTCDDIKGGKACLSKQ